MSIAATKRRHLGRGALGSVPRRRLGSAARRRTSPGTSARPAAGRGWSPASATTTTAAARSSSSSQVVDADSSRSIPSARPVRSRVARRGRRAALHARTRAARGSGSSARADVAAALGEAGVLVYGTLVAAHRRPASQAGARRSRPRTGRACKVCDLNLRRTTRSAPASSAPSRGARGRRHRQGQRRRARARSPTGSAGAIRSRALRARQARRRGHARQGRLDAVRRDASIEIAGVPARARW